MHIERLFEKEATIKISVVKIENKKLTKGIFNQINWQSPFDKFYNLKENVKFLGYVNDNFKCLVWTNGDSLYKYRIKDFYPFRSIDLNKNTINELIEIFPSDQVESLHSFKNEMGIYEYQELQISCVLDVKEQYVIIEKKENVEKIIKELLKRQIYL